MSGAQLLGISFLILAMPAQGQDVTHNHEDAPVHDSPVAAPSPGHSPAHHDSHPHDSPAKNAPAAVSPAPPATPRDTSLIEEARKQSSSEPFSRRELGFDGRRMNAIDAVRITLEYSPQILLQDTEVLSREGGVRRAQGEFDTHITARTQADLKERRRGMFTRPSAASPTPTPTPYPNPLVHRTSSYEFELGLSQRLRNGVVLEPKVAFRPGIDKDFNNNFNNANEASVSFGVFIPLAKGGGRLVNEAPEIAARFDLLASVFQLRFLTSQSVRETLLAYWRCRSAEERYKLFVESEAISSRLVKLSVSLVEADELAPSQLPQILADRNTTIAARINSESQLILARQRLAIAMGYNPDVLVMAPLTADPFPKPPARQAYPDLNKLWFLALNLRDDLRASKQLEKSRKILMDAAFLELRPRIDLQLRATQTIFETRSTATTSEGHETGLFASLSADWPIQNNSAIGSFIESTATYDRSQIETENLKRAIVSGVISSMAELQAADAELLRYAEAARLNAKALAAQEELFRLGQASLTDTITSRQRLIQSQLDYIGAQERYAMSVVQLRFETGLLFYSDAGGNWIDERVWQTVPLLPGGNN